MDSTRRLKRTLASWIGAVAASLTLAGPASATIYDFDMTGLAPGPAYDSVVLNYTVTLGGGAAAVGCIVYDDLGGVGAFISGCAKLDSNPYTYTDAGIVDGIFSIDLAYGGDLTVGIPFVVGVKSGVRTEILVGRVHGVPEPATLALLAFGLAGLGFSRRKQ